MDIFGERKDVRFVTEDQISIKGKNFLNSKNVPRKWFGTFVATYKFSHITCDPFMGHYTYQLHKEICSGKYHNTIRFCFGHFHCLIFHSNLVFEIQLFKGHGYGSGCCRIENPNSGWKSIKIFRIKIDRYDHFFVG